MVKHINSLAIVGKTNLYIINGFFFFFGDDLENYARHYATEQMIIWVEYEWVQFHS